MANRVSQNPNDDARKIAAEAAQKAELQRVNKVESVDPDQKAKQNRFRSLMQPTEEEESDSAATTQPAPSPSPAQPSFYQSTKNSGIDSKLAMPSPAYSPPPDVSEISNSFELLPEDSFSDEGLPQSPEYYQSSELPWDPINEPNIQEEQPPVSQPTKEKTSDVSQPLGRQQFQKGKIEQTKDARTSDEIKKGPASPHSKGKQIEASPFGPPGKPLAPKPFSSHVEHKKTAPSQSKKGEESIQPTSRFWDEEKTQRIPPSALSEKKEPEKKIAGTVRSNEPVTRPQERKAEAKPFEPVLEKAGKESSQKETKGESKGHEGKKDSSGISSPSLSTLPANIQPAAEAAAVAAASYIRPETLSLFYQTIGTILLMPSTSGVSKTSFLLNNPAFANSKFYGSSIEITRFSTAPDAFNIRLTGNTEAVNAFNQSIPGLMSAFQNGNFNFRINRIEAEHSTEKAMFHRKERSQDKGDSSGKQGNDK